MPRKVNDALDLVEQTAPAAPATGAVRIYAKADGLLYSKDDANVETPLGVAGQGGSTSFASLAKMGVD